MIGKTVVPYGKMKSMNTTILAQRDLVLIFHLQKCAISKPSPLLHVWLSNSLIAHTLKQKKWMNSRRSKTKELANLLAETIRHTAGTINMTLEF